VPPRGGPEGSPPRQGAPNLLPSIVPRRYDTSHHAGGSTQSATGSSASIFRVGRESNSIWGESSGCPRPTNLFTSFTRLVSQQASPPASIRIPAVRRSAAATQGMPTTGDLLRDFETGDVSVDTLPNTPLLLSNISSPSCQAVAIATPCCEHKRILAVRRSLAAALGTPTCYDRRPPLPFGTWSRVCQFTPKPTSPSGQRFTSFRQAVAIATVCCQQRRIHADRCSCTIQHLEPCQVAQLVAARG
jgi:hypothetical protein